MTVIYALCDPDTLEVRYVGKARVLDARLRSHRWEGQNTRSHKSRWLRTLASDPAVVVLEDVGDGDWEAAERRWIAHYREAGRLTNIAPGGETSPVEGRHHTEASKSKMRASAIANGARPPSQRGVSPSPETRDRLRVASLRAGCTPPPRGGWNRGLRMSPEFVEANRQSHIGRPWSEARRAAQLRKVGI